MVCLVGETEISTSAVRLIRQLAIKWVWLLFCNSVPDFVFRKLAPMGTIKRHSYAQVLFRQIMVIKCQSHQVLYYRIAEKFGGELN